MSLSARICRRSRQRATVLECRQTQKARGGPTDAIGRRLLRDPEGPVPVGQLPAQDIVLVEGTVIGDSQPAVRTAYSTQVDLLAQDLLDDVMDVGAARPLHEVP